MSIPENLKQEAAERGKAWGMQEAQSMQEAIDNGHYKQWIDWKMGTYCGQIPLAAELEAIEEAAGLHSEPAEAIRKVREEYETILDQAAREVYSAEGHKYAEAQRSARVENVVGNIKIVVEADGDYREGVVTIELDGLQYEREAMEGDNWAGATWEASYAAERIGEMLAAGMLRRNGDTWELCDNAEHPVPDGFVPDWPDDGPAKPEIWYATDGNATIEIEAESSKEAAQEYVDGGDWGPLDSTTWITVHCWQQTAAGRKLNEESHTITLNPEEPACTAHFHNWLDLSVNGNGGGVTIRERCAECGLKRTTNTWAQNPETGEQGLRSVQYSQTEGVE